MIRITVKHKQFKTAEEASTILTKRLQSALGNRIIGPSIPGISRIRGMYQFQITIKMEKKKSIVEKVKSLILHHKEEIMLMEGKKALRISLDVDP